MLTYLDAYKNSLGKADAFYKSGDFVKAANFYVHAREMFQNHSYTKHGLFDTEESKRITKIVIDCIRNY
jgi:hypothetical protein